MKNKILIKIERVVLLVVLIGLLLKFLKTEFGGIVLVVSMSSLSLLYFVYIIPSFKEWNEIRSVTIINALLYFFLGSLILGVLYLIMFWPGGHVIIYQTFKIYFFIIIVGVVYSIIKGRQTGLLFWYGIKTAFIKYSIALFIGVMLSILPTDILIKVFAKDPQLIKERLENNNQ